MNFGSVRRVVVPSAASRVFEGVLFDVFQWDVEEFNGDQATYEMVRRPDAAVVLVADQSGRLLVTEQEQTGVDRPFYDFPGGRVEPHESAEAAAKRELREETGISARELRLIFEFQPSDRVDYRTYVFTPTLLDTVGPPEPDPGERIECTWLSLDEVRKWALVNHRLAIVPVLLARDTADLLGRDWARP